MRWLASSFMTPAQIKVQECLEALRFARNIPCPACSHGDDVSDCVPCYCFEDFASSPRAELKAAKKARRCEKRALANKADMQSGRP